MKVVVINIQLLTCINIIQASVRTFTSDGDPIIGQTYQLRCTVDSFGSNVYIYKSSTESSHELVCDRSLCVSAGSGKYTGTVDGNAITIHITTLTFQENKYWICKQDSSTERLFLNVYSVPSSIKLKGPSQPCDLGQNSCKFTCTTDGCAFPTPTFTWIYVFDNGTTKEIPHRSSISEQSANCAVSTKNYEDTLTFPQYELFPGNTQTTVKLQCSITFSGLSSGERTSDLSHGVIFAVKVSSVKLFYDGTELTDSTFTVTEPEEKLLHCIAGNGNPTPTVQWFIENTPVSTESQFRLIPANSYHDQQLYCVADNIPNNGHDAVSNRLVLYVKVKIKFVYIEPAADTFISVIEDMPEPVLCTTSAGRPGSAIKWYKNNAELGEGDSPYFEKTDNNLNVTKSKRYVNISRSDSSWILSCSASNFEGSSPIWANNSKQLDVLHPPEHMSLSFDGKTVTGNVVDVIKGTSGTLTCAASSHPPVSKFSWNIKRKVGNNLTIDNNIQNGQTVNCTAKNTMTSTAGITKVGYGLISTKINLLYGALIERIELNGVNGSTSSPLIIKEKSPILIACYVDSNPDSTISLFQGINRNRLTEKATSKVLFYNISSAQCSDTSQYTCEAENGITNTVQPASMTIQINVVCSPRLAVDTEPSEFAQENTSAVLTVTILAYPIPTQYDWQRNTSNKWEKLKNSSSIRISSSIRMTQASLQFSLTFTSVKPEDYGEYKLTVYYLDDVPFNFTGVLKAKGEQEPHTNQPDDGSTATAGIIGGVVGGLILVCLIVIVICILRRRNSLDDIKTKLFGKKSTALREEIHQQDTGYSYAAVEKPTGGSTLNIIDNANAETKLGGESTPTSGYLYSEVNKSGKDNPMTIMQDNKASESVGGKNKAKKTKAAPETTNEGPCYENPTVLIESDPKAKPQKKGKSAKQKDKKQVPQNNDGLQYVELSFSDTKKKGKKTKPAQPKADERTVYDAVQFGVVGAAYNGEENDSKN